MLPHSLVKNNFNTRNIQTTRGLSTTPSSNTTSTSSNNIEIEYKPEIDQVLKRREFWNNRRGSLEGYVVSDKPSKSVIVQVDSKHYISKYRCMAPTRSRIMAHDELEECNTGMCVMCRYVILILIHNNGMSC